MLKPEHIRFARRAAVVAGAVATIGGLAYAGASAVSKSEDVARRLTIVEAKLGDLARLEGKVDALLDFFRIRPKE